VAVVVALIVGVAAPARAQVVLADPGVVPSRHEVVLVFEPASGKQHLFYRLRYRGGGAARVVLPVPAAPRLGEADDRLFEALDDLADRSRPPAAGLRVGRPFLLWDWLSPVDRTPPAAPAPTGPPPRQRKAAAQAFAPPDGATGLAAWAGTPAPAGLEPVTTRYLKDGWSLAAVRAGDDSSDAGGAGEQRLQPTVISFAAEQPVLPFRAPAAARRPVPLTLYVITTARVDGRLGSEREVPWPGTTLYARHLEIQDQNTLAHLLGPGVILPPEPYLTILAFDGRRPAGTVDADLFFNAAASQRWHLPPKSEARPVSLPGELLVIVLVWWGLRWRAVRRERARERATAA
jgi:hypothetical protein